MEEHKLAYLELLIQWLNTVGTAVDSFKKQDVRLGVYQVKDLEIPFGHSLVVNSTPDTIVPDEAVADMMKGRYRYVKRVLFPTNTVQAAIGVGDDNYLIKDTMSESDKEDVILTVQEHCHRNGYTFNIREVIENSDFYNYMKMNKKPGITAGHFLDWQSAQILGGLPALSSKEFACDLMFIARDIKDGKRELNGTEKALGRLIELCVDSIIAQHNNPDGYYQSIELD